jgi:hypothetical protein
MRILLVGNMTSWHVGAFFQSALQALGHPHIALGLTLYEQIAAPHCSQSGLPAYGWAAGGLLPL